MGFDHLNMASEEFAVEGGIILDVRGTSTLCSRAWFPQTKSQNSFAVKATLSS